MSRIIETIGEKLGLRGGGDKMQYLLVGALALVIVIAIVVIITSVTGGGKTTGVMKDQHYWDLAKNEELILKPEDFKSDKKGPGTMDPMMMGPMMGMGLMMNPKTGERTLLRMDNCPSCGAWYVPDMYKDARLDDFDERGMLIGAQGDPMMMGMGQNKICPKCGIDIIQYYRDKRKKK